MSEVVNLVEFITICNQKKMKKVGLNFNLNEFFNFNQVPWKPSWSTSVLQGLIVN